MERIKDATQDEMNIINFILSAEYTALCGAYNGERIIEVFEKFRKDILFYQKVNHVIMENLM